MKLPKVGDFVISKGVSLALYKCIKTEGNYLSFHKVKEIPEGDNHFESWTLPNLNLKAQIERKKILLEHEEIKKHIKHIQKEQLNAETEELFK